MAASAQTLINSAIGLGYDALSDRDLRECLLLAAQSGGGPGGTGAVVVGTGSPVGALFPTVDTVYINKTTGSIWFWSGAAGPWVETVA